jgi:S1-C subfamily serine protease
MAPSLQMKTPALLFGHEVVRMRVFIYIAILLCTLHIGCTSAPRMDGDRVTMDRPVIKNLSDVNSDLQKLQHSLVRLRVNNEKLKEESYGTGFFFRTRDMLVTTQHLFTAGHECLTRLQCTINLGFAKDSQNVTEQLVTVEVVLKNPTKDLIFLKLKNAEQFAQIEPLQSQAKNIKGTLTAAGFYQDNPALTFSQGQTIDNSLTSIIVSSGFSGSPVLNSKGELVGVVSSYKPIQGRQIGLAQYTTLEDSF